MSTGNAFVEGGLRRLLRTEALAVLWASLWAYHHAGGSWVQFALLFLLPDLALLAYWLNPRLGAWAYNTTHSALGPVLLLVLGQAHAEPRLLHIGLIWIAHISFDRALGFGLKYEQGFRHTHLGMLAAYGVRKGKG